MIEQPYVQYENPGKSEFGQEIKRNQLAEFGTGGLQSWNKYKDNCRPELLVI